MVCSSAGFVTFIYGKKQNLWKPMVAGLSMMALPYLLPDPIALGATGALIFAGLYVFRD